MSEKSGAVMVWKGVDLSKEIGMFGGNSTPMFRIIAVTDSFGHFAPAIEEYRKRLGKTLEIVTVKPERSEDPKLVVRKETERIGRYLAEKNVRPLYLDIGAKTLSTEAFATEIERRFNRSEGADFLIGGAYGVDFALLSDRISGTLSLSPMTLPHSLALLVLCEQIYRVEQIRKGSGYHH
ncbi:MAG: rRNA (pseudouridine1915-N3)-methyltransferase [Patescibacteria group bacterium]|nr:rRNA (pseudouridine1915-N3)-methyltransferase [Patescibacteria group bacterium]